MPDIIANPAQPYGSENAFSDAGPAHTRDFAVRYHTFGIHSVNREEPALSVVKCFQQYAFARIVGGRDEMLRVRSFMLHAPAVPLAKRMIRPVPTIFFEK